MRSSTQASYIEALAYRCILMFAQLYMYISVIYISTALFMM